MKRACESAPCACSLGAYEADRVNGMESISGAETGLVATGIIGRIELLESALDGMQEGIALLGASNDVLFWNRAAESITGYQGIELVDQSIPHGLAPLILGHSKDRNPCACHQLDSQRRSLSKLRHKMGHEIEVICRTLLLRNRSDQLIGAALLFRAPESFGALPVGLARGSETMADAQLEMEERLKSEFQDFEEGGPSFGVLCMTVDQAEELSRTHGLAACEALLEKLEYGFRSGLRSSETIGRWGVDEFLVVLHEPSIERLAAHARLLAGLARTVDFRWWGDRISITVSAGVAEARRGGANQMMEMLARARRGMEASLRAGGNTVTRVAGDQSCSPL